jgi:hypothetical protein
MTVLPDSDNGLDNTIYRTEHCQQRVTVTVTIFRDSLDTEDLQADSLRDSLGDVIACSQIFFPH